MERIVQTLGRSPRKSRRSIAAAERRPWSTPDEPERHDRGRAREDTRRGKRELRVREVMPPHYSPNLTWEQALEGWRRLEEEKRTRARRGRHRRPSMGEGST
jgi:hypothetical protein